MIYIETKHSTKDLPATLLSNIIADVRKGQRPTSFVAGLRLSTAEVVTART